MSVRMRGALSISIANRSNRRIGNHVSCLSCVSQWNLYSTSCNNTTPPPFHARDSTNYMNHSHCYNCSHSQSVLSSNNSKRRNVGWNQLNIRYKTTKTHSNVYNTFSSHKQSQQQQSQQQQSQQHSHQSHENNNSMQHPIHTTQSPLTSTFTSASTTLPTLDASPFLDPTLYIKKSTSHRNGIIRNTNNNTTTTTTSGTSNTTTHTTANTSANTTHASNNPSNNINTTDMNGRSGRGGGSISGSDGLKRLHRGKHLVMELFQQQQQQQQQDTTYSPSQRTTTAAATTTTHRINKQERIHGSSSNNNNSTTTTTTTHQSYATSNNNTPSNQSSNEQRQQSEQQNEQQQQQPFLHKFCLVGHGVPKQLLQDHVDMAWLILHSCTTSIQNGIVLAATSSGSSGASGSSGGSAARNDNSGGNGSDGASRNTHNSHVQESDVVECMFQPFMGTCISRNERGKRGNGHEGNAHEGTSNAASGLGLGFDWMQVRTKDGDNETLSWPLQPHCIPKSIPHTPNNSSTTSSSSSSSSSIDYPLQHRMDLYLAVMNRISTTFESILSTTHFSNATTSTNTSGTGTTPTDTTTTTTTSTNSTLPSWKVELLRGFVYPPSATILSNVYWDGDEECGGLVSDGICTSPPIVELIRNDDDNDDESSGSSGAKSSKRITHVRITLQGIPSKKLVSIPSMIMSNSTRQQQQEQGAEKKKNTINSTTTTTTHKAQPTHSTSFPNHFSDPTLSKPKTTPTSSSSSSSSSSSNKNKQEEEERKQRIKDESRRIFGPVEPQEQNISVVPVSLVFEARLSV